MDYGSKSQFVVNSENRGEGTNRLSVKKSNGNKWFGFK